MLESQHGLLVIKGSARCETLLILVSENLCGAAMRLRLNSAAMRCNSVTEWLGLTCLGVPQPA